MHFPLSYTITLTFHVLQTSEVLFLTSFSFKISGNLMHFSLSYTITLTFGLFISVWDSTKTRNKSHKLKQTHKQARFDMYTIQNTIRSYQSSDLFFVSLDRLRFYVQFILSRSQGQFHVHFYVQLQDQFHDGFDDGSLVHRG